MQPPSRIEQRRKLVMMIAESLALADQMELRLVGIALDSALAHLNGCGMPIDGDVSAH